MKEDLMNEVMDDAMGDEEDEEESEQIVNQVLDEIGVSLNQQIGELPSTNTGVKTTDTAKVPTAVGDADADLQARLDNLRRQ